MATSVSLACAAVMAAASARTRAVIRGGVPNVSLADNPNSLDVDVEVPLAENGVATARVVKVTVEKVAGDESDDIVTVYFQPSSEVANLIAPRLDRWFWRAVRTELMHSLELDASDLLPDDNQPHRDAIRFESTFSEDYFRASWRRLVAHAMRARVTERGQRLAMDNALRLNEDGRFQAYWGPDRILAVKHQKRVREADYTPDMIIPDRSERVARANTMQFRQSRFDAEPLRLEPPVHDPLRGITESERNLEIMNRRRVANGLQPVEYLSIFHNGPRGKPIPNADDFDRSALENKMRDLMQLRESLFSGRIRALDRLPADSSPELKTAWENYQTVLQTHFPPDGLRDGGDVENRFLSKYWVGQHGEVYEERWGDKTPTGEIWWCMYKLYETAREVSNRASGPFNEVFHEKRWMNPKGMTVIHNALFAPGTRFDTAIRRVAGVPP